LNFLRDVTALAKEYLDLNGVGPPRNRSGSTKDKNTDGLQELRWYFTYLLRAISPKPRRSVLSSEIGSRRDLADHLRSAIQHIGEMSERGEDLNGFQSERLMESGFNDLLVNDWGIKHLHLGGDPLGAASASGRTRELLYLIDRADALYMIDVGDHRSFAEDHLINVVHDNWPELLSIGGKDTGAREISTGTRSAFRHVGIMTYTKVRDGSWYAAPGGGYVTSGTSIHVVSAANRLARRVRHFEKWCLEELPPIVERNGWLESHDLVLTEFDPNLVALSRSSGLRLVVDQAGKVTHSLEPVENAVAAKVGSNPT
jgi:hypothetical protein